MKKYISLFLGLVCVLALSLQVFAAETLSYSFNGEDSLVVVTNTLASGGSAVIGEGVLSLDGTYGLKLGSVGNTFSVSAMVKINSTGGTNTIFFKDMDGVGNKWTGILSNGQKPAFWTHGTNHRWETVATGTANLGEWSHVAYVENNSVGSLYVNGELVGSGSVEPGSGDIYLGVTYWTADAVSGLVDNVKLYDNALSSVQVMEEYESCIDFENAIKLPKEVISDITLVDKIASKTVVWSSSNEKAIDKKGKVTRGEEDVTVTLTATIGDIGKSFEVTVLKKPTIVNEKVILSYAFDEKTDGDIIHDTSGNGNHAAAYNSLAITKDGARFDGVDDYVEMPRGVLYGHDEITIVATFKQNSAQKHVFLYGFGNASDTGYMFLNPSRPDTNLIHFAATKTGSGGENAIVSLPGVRNDEWATVAVVISGSSASLFVDGELVMDGDMGMKVSDLGETLQNYIGKSLYAADPYFAGVVKEFTVYDYCLSDRELSAYKKDVEYAAPDSNKEYIISVEFGGTITAEVDTYGREDVKVGAVVLDENFEVVEFCIVDPEEEISLTKDGTVCVFAFNEEDNVPGSI
ncbi:MAG: LamG domain-containing protein, partial [Clostridia bacterium]|nr:LamG domain-containing protein [Clostridia bacterium]